MLHRFITRYFTILCYFICCNALPLIALPTHCPYISDNLPTLNKTPNTFDVLTWNIKQFPLHKTYTIPCLATLILSQDIDIIAFQEITKYQWLIDLKKQLNKHSKTHWKTYIAPNPHSGYPKLGYLINMTDIAIKNSPKNILTQHTYNFAYRSPLHIHINYKNHAIEIVNVHYKCCGDGMIQTTNSKDEEVRRLSASKHLSKTYHNTKKHVIIAGDFNDHILDPSASNTLTPLLTSGFVATDTHIEKNDPTTWSYPSWPSHLDHMFISASLTPYLYTTSTMQFNNIITTKSYNTVISDHYPVLLQLKLP
ncbi:hypothetical protein DID76_03500 [Candidatus Marinamargulisbacteria bacterium SCGC AG-414-C22]|nr:hypothetical protein DID76_03500 [Candidatus Marinamargulisbacteria bacterium SCGC AG-414-C22]